MNISMFAFLVLTSALVKNELHRLEENRLDFSRREVEHVEQLRHMRLAHADKSGHVRCAPILPCHKQPFQHNGICHADCPLRGELVALAHRIHEVIFFRAQSQDRCHRAVVDDVGNREVAALGHIHRSRAVMQRQLTGRWDFLYRTFLLRPALGRFEVERNGKGKYLFGGTHGFTGR